jgi:hypothetical protein
MIFVYFASKNVRLIVKHDQSFNLNELELIDLQLNTLTYNENVRNVIKLVKLDSACLYQLDNRTSCLNYEISVTDENACEILYSNETSHIKRNLLKYSIDMKYTSRTVKHVHLARLFKKPFSVRFSQYMEAFDVSINDHK